MDLIRRIVTCPYRPGGASPVGPGAGGNSPAPCRGLPIGNLTSQFFANLYLDPWDHHVLEVLGCGGYLRYCDDFAVFGRTKAELRRTLEAARAFLARLRLELNDRKCLIYRTRDGVKFLGWKVYPDHRLLLPRSWRRARHRLRALQAAYAAGRIGLDDVRASLQGWLGHAARGDTWRRRADLLAAFPFSRGPSASAGPRRESWPAGRGHISSMPFAGQPGWE